MDASDDSECDFLASWISCASPTTGQLQCPAAYSSIAGTLAVVTEPAPAEGPLVECAAALSPPIAVCRSRKRFHRRSVDIVQVRSLKICVKLAIAREIRCKGVNCKVKSKLAASVKGYIDQLQLVSTSGVNCELQISSRKSRRKGRSDADHDSMGLHIVARESRQSKCKGFAPESDLRVAFKHILRVRDVASAMNCSEPSVRRIRSRVAMAYLSQQEALLTNLLHLCHERKPICMAHVLKFDEAKQKVSIAVADSRSSVAWNTLLSARHLLVVWEDGTSAQIDLVCPPEALTDTSASSCWEGLHA